MIIKGKRWNIQKKTEEVKDNNTKKVAKREKKAIKGTTLAESFNVTRQIIVKDIAILRAKGNNIIATPDGYMINDDNSNRVKSVIAVSHNDEDVIKELEIVVKYGGIIEDVIVEHPLYGEIKGILMIKNLNDDILAQINGLIADISILVWMAEPYLNIRIPIVECNICLFNPLFYLLVILGV